MLLLRTTLIPYKIDDIDNIGTSEEAARYSLLEKIKISLSENKVNTIKTGTEMNMPYVALNNITENEGIARVVVNKLEKGATLGDFSRADIYEEETSALTPTHTVYLGDFNKLIYLASRQDISDLLQVSTL